MDEYEELLKEMDRYFLVNTRPSSQDIKNLIHTHFTKIISQYEKLQRTMVLRGENDEETF